MKKKILDLKNNVEEKISKINDLEELDKLRVKILGKKGKLKNILRGMKDLSKDARPKIGKVANKTRDFITNEFENKFEELKEKRKKEKIKKETLDITLPGKKPELGNLHPVTETFEKIEDLFLKMGFDIASGPEIENEYYNFDALNIPESHPSRDLQDTFYVEEDLVLRTHTSPVQIRYMKEKKPPFRMVCPGKVYRADYDVSHTPMFHQIEGLMVGEDISFANLKAVLIEFVQEIFGDKNTRFRPHFFPFTEPSAEMDVECTVCGGKGCRLCSGTGWLEIMGCGMVDPNVLEEVGYDTEKYTGFAFGMGIERIAMLRHGISDLRAFYENDMRFLKQFRKKN
ncbi:MAG: phenylalanine--tRNA ligase subunit alpha [Fusobacteriota bacterium]